MLGKWVARFIGIASTLMLVRILTPDDFGIAAQSMMVVMLFEILSQSGSDSYIIRLKSANREQIDTAWTLNFFARLFIAIILFLFAEQIANFLNDDRLINVLRISCLVPILSILSSPNLILLKKEMRFDQLAKLAIFSKIVSFIGTISIALLIKNYWALIWGNLLYSFAMAAGSYFIAPKIPVYTFKNVKEQWSFTKKIYISSIVAFFRAKADIFVVSHLFGSSKVGGYSIAQEFSLLPLTEIISPIAQPLFSSLAKLDSNWSILEDKIYKYLSMIYVILIPSIFGMYYLSEKIVTILLGEQWLFAAPTFGLLSFLMLVFATNSAFKNIFILKDQFLGVILIDVFGLIAIFFTILIDQIDSIATFAQYRVFIGIVVFILTIMLVKQKLKFHLCPLFISLSLPVVASGGMLYILKILERIDMFNNNIYLATLFLIIISALSYFCMWFACIVLCKKFNVIWEFNYSIVQSLFSNLSNKYKAILR